MRPVPSFSDGHGSFFDPSGLRVRRVTVKLQARPVGLARRRKRSKMRHHVAMRGHAFASCLQVLTAALVIALGSGLGLPGLVRAFAPAESHVCTCASGGTHSACPVCNPSSHERRAPRSAIEGLPCGERTSALAVVVEPAITPVAIPAADVPFECARARRDVLPRPHTVFLERATPPPRCPST